MSRNEILQKIIDKLNLHVQDALDLFNANGKSDMFKLFKEAYSGRFLNDDSSPRLHADAIRADLLDGLRTVSKDEERNLKVIDRFSIMWDDWRYAWEHYDTKCKESAGNA